MSGNRYVLIDFMHLAHRTIAAEPLSATVNIQGEMMRVDTTVPNYTIKNVYSYSGKGHYHTGVFLEGGASKRKEYFTQQQGAIGATQGAEGYKAGRPNKNNSFFQGVDLAVNLMANGKVSLYRKQGFEADDCIASVVRKIKSVDQITPIDIITNDSDLLPLVDDQVSVYMRGTRTHAEEGCPERRLYFQVTPNSWDDYMAVTSQFKGYYIPYNSLLLFKFIRGDKADNIAGALKGYGKVKYSQLMEEMVEDEVDFANIFRYNVDFDEVIAPTLLDYFDSEVVEYMKFIYEGVNPYYENFEVPRQIEPGYLQSALNPVQIHVIR